MWYEQYLNTPWASPANPPHSFNCGDLARWVYKKHLGLDTPEIHTGCHTFKKHTREIERYLDKAGFSLVQDRQPFDIVRMFLGKRPCHIGIYTGDGILHSVDPIGVEHATVFELKNQYYKMEFVRHASRI